MNLLAIIIVFLAIVTAVAIAYVAWELSSGEPVFSKPAGEKAAEAPDRQDTTDDA